jgi:hypothetical protein
MLESGSVHTFVCRLREVRCLGALLAWPALAVAVGLLAACSSPEMPPTAEEGGPAKTETRRSGPAEVVKPLEPLGAVSLADGFTFRWEAPEDVDVARWSLRVYVNPAVPIWTARAIPDPELTASAALLTKLEPGQLYSWRVVGHLVGGGRIRSPESQLIPE